MKFKQLSLADRPVFREWEKTAPLTTADVNFTNLFIWRSYYHFTWTEAHGCLCVIARPEDGQPPFALPPLGPGDQVAAADFLLKFLTAETDRPSLQRVPQALAERLERAGAPVAVTADPDNDDYVYASEKLITLGGRRMHQKKNHYNYFINSYQYECLDINPGLIGDLMAVEENWLSSKEERTDGGLSPSQLQYELDSVHELLRHMEELEQVGLAVKVNGRIEGFTLGEALSDDTALIHVEKANPAIRGLFVALCSHFCRRRFAHLTYINREQDLGLPGLRQSKESLKPDHLRHKYVIRPA